MGKSRRSQSMLVVVKNYLRPRWVFRRHTNSFATAPRSPLYKRNEALFLLPAMHAMPQVRNYIANCLDRSFKDNGALRTFSGLGSANVRARDEDGGGNEWLQSIYSKVDAETSSKIGFSRSESFPIRKLFALCEEYMAVWEKDKLYGNGMKSAGKESFSERRGPFPFVDEGVGLIRELTHGDIFFTRSRVREWRHPKWKVYQWWRRKYFNEFIARRRANAKEAVKQAGNNA